MGGSGRLSLVDRVHDTLVSCTEARTPHSAICLLLLKPLPPQARSKTPTMISTPTLAAMLAAVAALQVSTTAAATCATAPYASCGSNAGTTCCPDGYYCQPWDAGFFQCVVPPAQCSQQFTNTDFYGEDIKTVYGIQPAECCTQCAQTAGCTAYTFVNSNPGSPACYLKKGSSDKRVAVGAVSGIVNGNTPSPTTVAPTPAPTPTLTLGPTPAPTPSTSCSTPAFGSCGNSAGTTCCPSGYYCQPWNNDYYQCIAPPAQCSRQLTDTDYYGNDIKSVSVSLPTLCCEECAKTAGCKAYTYINNNPGAPVCYLKSAAGTPVRLVGAVAGQLN
jgi:hypothetical protein